MKTGNTLKNNVQFDDSLSSLVISSPLHARVGFCLGYHSLLLDGQKVSLDHIEFADLVWIAPFQIPALMVTNALELPNNSFRVP